MERLTVSDYFERPESRRPMELVYGVVREPPAPRYGHQSVVTHLGALLDAHVREHRLGRVCVAPVDVVLDEHDALVVQPDIVFVKAERAGIIRDRVWGPPDLVVEVLSPRTATRDRTTKVAWYRRYGVAECWLVDVKAQRVDVVDLRGPEAPPRVFGGDESIASSVLPNWTATSGEVFALW